MQEEEEEKEKEGDGGIGGDRDREGDGGRKREQHTKLKDRTNEDTRHTNSQPQRTKNHRKIEISRAATLLLDLLYLFVNRAEGEGGRVVFRF